MPIKQIQLRGISRSPSDRVTPDGGVAESLNIHLAEGESAPTLPAEDVSEDFDLADGERVVFIHKTLPSTNAVYIKQGGIYAKVGELDNTEVTIWDSSDQDIVVKDITAIGNTLIAATDKGMVYALYKDGKYIYLGDRIPVPEVEFRLIDTKVRRYSKDVTGDITNLSILTNEENLANAIDRQRRGDVPTDSATDALRILLALINNIREQMNHLPNKMNGKWCAHLPVFARWAVRLYDGSYVYTSEPFLLGTGYDTTFEVYAVHNTSTKADIRYTHPYYYTDGYLRRWDGIENWTDVVESIDIFLSPFVFLPNTDAKITGIEPTASSESTTEYRFLMGSDNGDDTEELLLASQASFHLVYSAKVGSLDELKAGYNIFSDPENLINEKLVLKDELEDVYLSLHKYQPDRMSSFNNRLLAHGGEVELYKGSRYAVSPGSVGNVMNPTKPFPSGWDNPDYSGLPVVSYRFKWYINKSGVEYSVLSDTVPGYEYNSVYVNMFRTYVIANGTTRHSARSVIKGWLCYPDPNCTRVDVEVTSDDGTDTTVTVYTAKMKQHPRLAVSYLFWGMENEIGVGEAWENAITHSLTITSFDSTQKMAAIRAVDEVLSVGLREAKDILENRLPYLAMTTSDYQALTSAGAILTNGHVTYTQAQESSGLDPTEKKRYASDNVIRVSPVDNPFYFPESGYLTMFSTIIGTGIVTHPLSEGQFGQFSLYVFTSDGIYTVPTSSAGTFLKKDAVSREVAVSSEILSMEQAVVFVTDKGVMMLQGSQVTNLSPFMNGRHYTLEDDVKTILQSDSEWSGLVPSTADGDPFMAFMGEAKIGYDYKGGRLLFFNDTKPYQYVYMLGTQSWHKVSGSVGSHTVLNSYPDCYVAKYVDRTDTENKLVTIRVIGGSPTHGLSAGDVRSDVEGMLPGMDAGTSLESLPQSFLWTTAEADAFIAAIESYECQRDDHCVYYTVEQPRITSSTLLDYSTVLDDADVLSDSASSVKGIIVTRPFDLGEPDIRKTIRSIRIRGQYNRGDVKYILCGSMDGTHWQRLTSLRGGSYRLFRIIILASLAPTERISWIDVDYESRFNDKLR